MKIALFHNMPPGGAKRALFEHARLLHERGHTLDAYVMSTATEEYLPLAPLCRRVIVRETPALRSGTADTFANHSLSRLFWRVAGQNARKMTGECLRVRGNIALLDALDRAYAALAAEIDAEGYDLVYAHHCRVLLSPALLRHLKTPCVYYCHDTLRHVHEWSPDDLPDYDRIPAKLGLSKVRGLRVTLPTLRLWHEEDRRNVENARAATLVLANSFYSREAIQRTCGVNARVCDLGVDTAFFCPDRSMRRENVVLSVGSIAPLKRHDFILDAIATIPAERRPAMQIIGYDPVRFGQKGLSPDAERLFEQARRLGVELRLDKEITDKALRDSYRQAGVVAFASYLEPFGLVTLEAMACATPVVAVAEAGLRETVQDGVTGLLTERDAVAYGTALDRALTDQALAERLGRAGREAAVSRWNWSLSADRLETLFELALAQNTRVDAQPSETSARIGAAAEAICASR